MSFINVIVLAAIFPASWGAPGPEGSAAVRRAQPPALAGEWRVTWDSDVTSRDGTVIKVKRRSTARLVLCEHGDSITGRWVDGLLSEPGAREPGVPVKGTRRGDSLVVTTGTVPAPRGTVRVTMRGLKSGARLSGTMLLEVGGLPPAPRAWEAIRQR